MSRTSLGRLGLMFVSLLGLMSLFSGSAFAAGKPTSVNLNWASPGITHIEVKGTANPNGAATTVQLEYQNAGVYQTFLTKEIGSGTSSVNVNGMLNGLAPQTDYYLRVSATNKYGTVYSFTEHFAPRWEAIGAKTAGSFASSGTAKFEYTAGAGTKVKIECNESGTGTIGSAGAVGDGYHGSFSGCVLYQDGAKVCNAPSTTVNLNGAFVNEASQIAFPFPEGCFYSTFAITTSEPFFINMPLGVYQVTQPITLTEKGTWGGNVVTTTITSNWHLTGANSGLKFGGEFE
jgi:hypothetical protein